MKAFNLKMVQMVVPFFALIILFSCNKDSDLLVEYVVPDRQNGHLLGDLIVNDYFVVARQKSVVLDVLANDTIRNRDKVKIVETSQPENGTVVINTDKTLTYFPDLSDVPDDNPESQKEDPELESDNNGTGDEAIPTTNIDTGEPPTEPSSQPSNEEKAEQKEEQKEKSETFEYTVETIGEKGSATTQNATVTVTIDPKAAPETEGKNLSDGKRNYPQNAVFASSFGFRPGDATKAFVAALKSGSSYVVIDKQSSDWVIESTRIFDLHDMTIVFEPGVTLRAKPGAFVEGNRLFELTRAKNVIIEGAGATFQMNKNEYTSGEQRHALQIDRCNDITIRGLTIKDSGGAGIMISGDGKNAYSKNITVENVRSLNNRRDGITIVSAENVWVRNSEFSGSSGTKPEAGVVLEPDAPGERLVNINFINCKFFDNNSAGIHLATIQMKGSTVPLSVNIVDCEFGNNAVSPEEGVVPTEVYLGGGQGTDVVEGEIRFEGIKFNSSRGRIIFTRKSANGFQAVFKDCEAQNVVSAINTSPIGLEADSARNTLGGMEFDNFYIQYSRNVPFMHINAPSRDGSFEVKNINGDFLIKTPHNNPLKYSGGYKNNKNVNVSIKYKHI